MKQVIKRINENTIEFDGVRYTKEQQDTNKNYDGMVFEVSYEGNYFHIDEIGDVSMQKFLNTKYDTKAVALGVFLTREDAQKEANKRKAIARLKQSRGARPFVAGDDNYCGIYDHCDSSFDYDIWNYFEQPDTVYFDTAENCKAAHTPEIIEALWGVK